MMKFGTAIYSQGAIALVPFPFSNLSSAKVRPVLIIFNNRYNKKSADVVVRGITSNLKPARFSILLEQKDLQLGHLKCKSKIKVDALTALEKSIIIKTIGFVKLK